MFDHVEAFYRPGSIPEALRLFQTGNGAARFLAGGTDLINQADREIRSLIDLSHLGLNYIRRHEGEWVIGATATLADLEASSATRALAGGILLKAASQSGPVQVRNMATVGGRLINGQPYCEIATPLLALDAMAVLAHARRRMKTPLADLLSLHGRTLLQDVLLVEVSIPALPGGGHTGWSFLKLGRTESDVSLVNVAAGLQIDRHGSCRWARIAIGAVEPAPMRASHAENLMIGRKIDETLIDVASNAVLSAVKPTGSVRGSAEYLREMCRVMTQRALLECAQEAGCEL
jgi:carbon-monoxide dehydrogenase medium subunit